METSSLVIFKIGVSFTALFILPFILVSFKIFHEQDRLFQIYISMIIGLFSSVASVYVLAIFGAFSKINFLIFYGAIILVSNLYFLRQTKKPKISFKVKLTPGLLLLLFAFGIGSYMRLYDPLVHVALGSGDSYWHLQFFKSTAAGEIFASYPRAYHIILALIHFVANVDSYAFARFVGPVFGIISIGGVYCLMKYVGGKKAAIFATLFYSGFSLFNYLTIEEISLFAQSFGFVLIPFVILFALELVNNFKDGSIRRRNILVFIFTVFVLSLISPYTMLQMSYILYFLLLFSIAFHSSLRKRVGLFLRNVTALAMLFSLGIIIVFSYYTLLNEFRSVGLAVPVYDESQITALVEEGETEWEAMEESAKYADWKTSKWAIAKGLLRMKRLRVPVQFPLSIGVYVGLLLSLIVLGISIARKRLDLFAVGIFTCLFGISSITGILELPWYTGRSGWYFMLGSIWLGGILAKRFYDQELIRDIFRTLKTLVPLRIRNKAKNIKESRAALLYFILTSSLLVTYLAITSALGLLRLNPARDTLLLLLIPATIFIVSKKKRDILSWERVPYRSPEKAGPYFSLHRSLVLTVVLVAMLYPFPKPPEFNFRYYHRSANEDDFVKVVQKVRDEYPLSEVKLFFDNDIVRGAVRKTKNIVYPQRVGIVGTQSILSGIGDKRYNFLFLDCAKEESESLKKIREWVSTRKELHNNVRFFYDSDNIVVYLVENY